MSKIAFVIVMIVLFIAVVRYLSKPSDEETKLWEDRLDILFYNLYGVPKKATKQTEEEIEEIKSLLSLFRNNQILPHEEERLADLMHMKKYNRTVTKMEHA